MGAPELASHLFAFYFGILANVTPPVALAAYAAASIAKADLNRTGYQAFKLAMAGFIVPFCFIYDTSLLLDGAWPQILIATATAACGVFLLAIAIEGWFLVTARHYERALLAVAALMMIWSSRVTELAGLAIAVAIVAVLWRRAKTSGASDAVRDLGGTQPASSESSQ